MRTYKLLPEGFEPARRFIRNMGIGLFLFMLAFVLFLQLRDPKIDLMSPISWIVIPFTLAVIAFALYQGMSKALKIQQEKWLSYELLLDNEVVIRKVAQTPEVAIPRSEVTGLQEVPNKHLVIKTNDKRKFIIVPTSLDGYKEVKEHLAKWQNLETLPPRSLFQQSSLWLTLGMIAGCSVVWISQNIQIVLPVGFLLIAVFIWSTIETWRSPNADSQLKRNSGFTLGIVLLGIAVKTFILWNS